MYSKIRYLRRICRYLCHDSSHSRFAKVGAAVFLLALSVSSLFAQIGGMGSISGTIADSSGAVVGGATVSARNIATGITSTRKSSSVGAYLISPLPPGEYTVKVEAQGFQKLSQEHVVVNATQATGLNLTLQVGSENVTITVSTAPPALQTENGSMGYTLEQRSYTNLPLNMGNGPRNPTAFVSLMPGYQSGGRSGNFNGSGSDGYLDEMYIDGIPLTAPVQQGDNRPVAYALSPEMVDQFQLMTSGTPVEYQGQGSQNYVVKSGTNKFHGSVYEYIRNTIFDTWGFSAPAVTYKDAQGNKIRQSKPPEHQNEYGFALGGPVLKNKLFFFTSYSGYHFTKIANPALQTVPTLKARTGDFSDPAYYPIYDPVTTTACTAANKGTRCRTQFSSLLNGVPTNNVIPDSRISPLAKKLQSFLPDPSNSAVASNLLVANPSGNEYWKTASRVDYNLSERQKISGLLLLGHYQTIGPDYTTRLPLPYGTAEYVKQFTMTADIEHNYVITPNLVNQFKYAYNRMSAPDVNATLNTQWTAAKLGMTGLLAGEASDTFPAIAFSGGTNNPTNWHSITGSISQNEVTNTFVLIDNLQWVHGHHQFTFGAQLQWLQDNYIYPANSNSYPMSFSFNSNETAGFYPNSSKNKGTLDTADSGVAYASYLLGAVHTGTSQITAAPELGARFRPFSPYVQDDYKIKKNLTINLGLRWDLFPPFHEVQNRSSFLNPNLMNPLVGIPGALQFYGYGDNSCHCQSPIETWYKNFGPRVGFAYSPGSKTVLRGAYGIVYSHGNAQGGHNSGSRTGPSQLGYSTSLSLGGDSYGAAAYYWDQSPSGIKGDNVFGVGTFPGTLPSVPNYDPSQHAGYSTNYKINGAVQAGSSITYADPTVGKRSPYFQNWNFGVQRALTNDITLSVNYVGSVGHFISGTGRGYWTNGLDPKYEVLGALLNQTPSGIDSSTGKTYLAEAQAIMPGIALPFATYGGAGTIGQMLKPFPQFSGVTDIWGNVGNTSYNALQLTLSQVPRKGLSYTVNYTYGKGLGNTDYSRIDYPIPAGMVKGIDKPIPLHGLDRTFTSNDQPQRLVFYSVYELPVGKGRTFSGGNRVTAAILRDWQLSGILTYESGNPVSITSSKCVFVGGGTCYPNYNPSFSGSVRQNGFIGKGYVAGGVSPVYLNKNAFQAPDNYMIGNVAASRPLNLWTPSKYNSDASIRRAIPIYEGVKFTFQADCFNITNKTSFGYASTNIDASNFGMANSGSGNRDWQLSAKIEF